MKYILPLIFLCLTSIGTAQVPVNSWRSHLPMGRFQWAGELPGLVLGANQYGVIVFDEEDGSLTELTKINVLTQTDITAFACDYTTGLCIVGYGNGNLDIISVDLEVINQPAVVSSNVVGDKRISAIVFEGSTALITTGIGILELNLETYNVNEYARVLVNDEALEVLNAVNWSDQLVIATSNGVYSTQKSDVFSDPVWQLMPVSGNPENVSQFFVLENELYAIAQDINYLNDTLLQWNGSLFGVMNALAGMELGHVEVRDNRLLITQRYEVVEYDQEFSVQRRIFTYSSEPGMDAKQAIYAQDGNQVIIADELFGVVKTSLDDQYASTFIRISTPRNGVVSKLDIIEETVYAMPGGNDFTFNPPFLFSFENEAWSSDLIYAGETNSQRNTSGIVKRGSNTYVGFDGGGLVILDASGQVFEYFDEANAVIEDDPDGYYGLKGLALDDLNSIWMLNSRAASTLSALDAEGNWSLISIPGYPKPIVDHFMLHSSGILVFSLKDNGIMLYDPAGTPSVVEDDRFTVVNSSPSNGSLPNNTVNCIIEDKDGELWIGTDEGVGVIYSPEAMLSGSGEKVQKIIVNQDGYNGYLFESDAVIAIATDGANRKWITPRGGGLFLISADGQEQILRFTADDSPLLNDNVSDLVVHPISGEVFIATESGLQSFRSDATEASDQLSSIKVFPNPVKPGYGGWITFTGMSEGSYVRITDTSGFLVFETRSKGGTAIWDGRDRNGQKVSSGIYLVFSASQNGAGGAV